MNWLKSRLSEPSTWGAISAVLIFKFLWGVMPASTSGHWLLIGALIAAMVGFMLEEGK